MGSLYNPHILQIGLGQLGSVLMTALRSAGWSVQGARRHPTQPSECALNAAQPWASSLMNLHAMPTDVVLCLAPSGRTLAAYQQAYWQPAHEGLRWCQAVVPQAHVWLISSTSVYAQQQGEWVDEWAPAEPQRPTAQCIQQAEQVWLDSPQPVTVLRLGGLYGPGREYLLRQAAQPTAIADAEPIYTNRIHVNDVAGALVHLLKRRHAGQPVAPIYNVVDQDPAPLQAILPAIRAALGWPEPTEVAQLGRGSKRVSAQALANTGFIWRYPSWRDGYAEILAAKRNAGVTAQMQLADAPLTRNQA